MKLSESNPYLRDPVKRAQLLRTSAASSSAIEGIRKPFEAETESQMPKTQQELVDFWKKPSRKSKR